MGALGPLGGLARWSCGGLAAVLRRSWQVAFVRRLLNLFPIASV